MGEGEGVYGGPAEERIATDAERETLKAGGWTETRIKTLWIAPPGQFSGMFSVDEALVLCPPLGTRHESRIG